MKSSFFAILLILCAAAHADEPFAAIGIEYSTMTLPVLQSRCLDCHDAESNKGELNLERLESLDQIRHEPEIWQKVVQQIEDGEMPPKDEPPLTAKQRKQLLTWAKTYLNAEAQANAGDPGPVTLRRLNNAEYTYTIRDLTGIASLNPASEFPTDSAAGEGFTNTGDALVMSPALLEKYYAAGKRISEHAVLLEGGFRFSNSTTRRDRANAIVDQIRTLYLDKLQAPMIDFSYRSSKEVGQVAPSSASEGRLDYEPYIRALIEHRDRLKAPSSATSIAVATGLNATYLHRLTKALASAPARSLLLNQLRQSIQSATSADAPAITAWVNGWQEQLWRFQSVGHLGIIRSWQESVNPINDRRDLELTLASAVDDAPTELSLTASTPNDSSAEAAVFWETPRIARAGKPPVLLRDVRAATAVFARFRSETLSALENLLAAAFDAKQSNDTELSIDTLARTRELNVDSLKIVFAWLGIENSRSTAVKEPLTGRLEQAAGQNSIQGWTQPGLADLSILGNASDSTWRIPGEAPPGRIVVHPRPERWIAAGWQSPISEPVTITAHVQDRHVGCGNGVTWSVQQQRGSQRRVLRTGEFGAGGVAEIKPIEKFLVKQGDLISISIGARDGNHSCDLTEIELAITSTERTWSLTADCASSMLAGNPHADSYGNLSVWHFYTGLNDGGDNWQLIPEGSLLAEWMDCTSESDAAKLATEIAKLAAQPQPQPPSTDPNAALHQQLTSADGALFSHTDFGALAASAKPEEIENSPYGLNPARFDANGNLSSSAPDAIHFSLPAKIFGSDASLVVSGRVRDDRNDQMGVQLRLVSGRALASQQLTSEYPITVAAGTSGRHALIRELAAFRELFPAAMCYTRIVPIDEVVTLVLYHREDDYLQRLMLTEEEIAHLNALWDELHFVSQDAYQIVDGLEQILEFATQDADPSRFFPLREPIAARAAALRSQLTAAEPAQLNALIDFAALAYRRPLAADESAELRSLYADLRMESLPHDEAFRMVLARIVAAPQFLYRAETPPSGVKQGPVDRWELATRLSYFLTASAPDAGLRESAASGTLLTFDTLTAETRRLLQSENARRLAIEFSCQWLHVRDFDQFDEKSETHFPEFAELRGAMYEETIRFFTDLFQNNGSILDILNADYVFVNDSLADFYGLPGVSPEWRKVDSAQRPGRGGILAMATTLAKQSGASRTSPILRGNWVSETLLGEKLPKPPPGVPTLPETPPAGLSERELIEQHSSDPSCAKCHARIDPYGFALESYDAVGRLRELANTETRLADGTQLNGLDGLRHYLSETRRDTFVLQFCRKLLGYALGRSVRLSDQPLLDNILEELSNNNYRISVAVEMIVRSPQFREIRGDLTS